MGRRKAQMNKTAPRQKEPKTSTSKDRDLRRDLLHKGWLIAGGILTILASVHFPNCIAERNGAVSAFKESATSLSAATEKHLQSFAASKYREFLLRNYLRQDRVSRSELERGLNEVVASFRVANADCNDYKAEFYKYVGRKDTIDRLFRFKEPPAPLDENQCEVFVDSITTFSALDPESLANDATFRYLVIKTLPDEPGFLRLKTKLSAVRDFSQESKKKTEEVIKTCEQRTSSLLLNIWDCCRIF